MKSASKYLIYSILAITLCAQFIFNATEFTLYTDSQKQIIILVGLGLASTYATYSKWLSIPKSFLTLLFLSMLGLILMSGLWAVHISLLWHSTIAWIIYLSIYILSFSIDFSKFKSIFFLLILFIITINTAQVYFYLISALVENEWQIKLQEIEKVPKIFGRNGNYIGSLMILYIPILMDIKSVGFLKKLALINIFFIASLLPIFNSRGVTLALIILGLYYMWVSYRHGYLFRCIGFIITISGFVFIFYQLFIIEKDNYLKTYNPIRSLTQDTGDDRILLWKNAIELFSEKPILGHGAGNFKTEILKYGTTDYKNGRTIKHAHNYWIETIVELGIIGLLLVITIELYAIYFSIKNRLWNLLAMILALLSLCIFYGIYREGVFTFSSHFLILFIWLGIALKKRARIKFSMFQIVIYYLFFGVAVFLCHSIISFDLYLSELSTAKKNYLKEKLIKWDDNYNPYINEFKGKQSVLYIKSNHLWKAGQYRQAINYNKIALEIQPYDRTSINSLARKYEQDGKFDQAAEYYQKALNYYTEDIQASLGLTRIGLKNGNEQYYEAGIKLYNETILPSFESYYEDEFLTWNDSGVSRFWLKRCEAIDKFQTYNKRWESMQKKSNR